MTEKSRIARKSKSRNFSSVFIVKNAERKVLLAQKQQSARPIADAKIKKGARFRRASDQKIASIQRSFERARRGKGLFGLEEHAE